MSKASASPHDHRFLPLDGTLNTRDLGGLPVAGNGQTRFGVFFRSDVPMDLGAADFEKNSLAARSGIDYQNVEIWGHIDAAGDRPTDPWDITAFYLRALDHAGPGFVRVMTLLANARGASLFHCTAGKDRTGLVAALLLEAVGVDRDTIIEDFALTHDRIDPLRRRLLEDAAKHGVKRSDFERLLGATPDLMLPALDYLATRYGGATAYLRANGLRDEQLAALRHKLVA